MFDWVLNTPLEKVLFLMYLLQEQWYVIFTTLLRVVTSPRIFPIKNLSGLPETS